MFHLTARVAWHDSRWDGRVCSKPSRNSFCTSLDRIRLEKIDEEEDRLAGREWSELSPNELPPCQAVAGAFMNPNSWTRTISHPYVELKHTRETHGHLEPTSVKVPPYGTFAVPYRWLLRSEQQAMDESLPDEQLPPDEDPPIDSAWVFGRARQEALLRLFSGRLTPEQSLVLFYCPGGQPIDESISQLVIGVGRITKLFGPMPYESVDKSKPSYCMWDLLFRHSIRPDNHDGFVLPYHEYLAPTGDSSEDARRLQLLRDVAVAVDEAYSQKFSYGAELASSDVALPTLVRCLEAVRKIKEHGIVEGPWDRREDWLNDQIAQVWQDRGSFPGLGSALEAVGMRLGTALSLELLSSGIVDSTDDPWPIFESMVRGDHPPPQSAYSADLESVRDNWLNLPEERRSLLKLLSRFAFTPKQALRWFDPSKRTYGASVKVSDSEILRNPYRMSEVDLGERNDSPVSIGMIDRGLLPDSTVVVRHPVPAPSNVGSPNDPRRLRSAIVAVLRERAANGDSLLSTSETLERSAKLDLARPCDVPSDWPVTNRSTLDRVVETVEIVDGNSSGLPSSALQLTEVKKREDRLRSILSSRAARSCPTQDTHWEQLLEQAIQASGGNFDISSERDAQAINEKATALERVTSRKLSVLVGQAGTGKTTVMGALMSCEPISKDGILLLAPTGRARVRLGRATKSEAMTIAQFLYGLGRYDGARQMPLFDGSERYRREKTVVIDECSMLTMDDLVAVLLALDLAHVQRLILVGDPNQLPPIGVGRPFADFVSYLETTNLEASDGSPLGDALARLTVEVRSVSTTSAASDSLRLASWFTREPQPVDADRVLSDLELGSSFNDLDLMFWKTPEDLREQLVKAFQHHLGLESSDDVTAFNASLGIDEKGWVPYDNPQGSEEWQILSPVRMHPYGVHELNRWIQRKFRSKELPNDTGPRGQTLGDENIVRLDKVIQTSNQHRNAYNGESQDKYYLANGEVGLVATLRSPWFNVLFADRPQLRFGYRSSDFPSGAGPLQLAYALTVHKSQGSEFGTVFVVLPKKTRLLSRELLYTALTRSRSHLVLLIEGENASALFDLSRPERSETARRNTNLFQEIVRTSDETVPYAENLIHRTEKGHLVRSKSELVIANMLHQMEIEYDYERVCDGTVELGKLRPDFSFTTPAGDLIIWEHLGLLERPDYRKGWEWKHWWYKRNGFIDDETLFTSVESSEKGLDSKKLRATAQAIKKQLE